MSAARPRVLVITPDFPPPPGGIQVLLHRVAAGLEGFDARVLTLSHPGSREFDASSGVPTVRVPAPEALGAGRNAVLGAATLALGARLRPHVVLSGHIVTSPAAYALRSVLGARTVQYFYAKEIGARPRLAAFAAGRADASIAISSYTESLLAAAGVDGADVRRIPPGVDLPVQATPLAAERPTIVTVSRLADPYKGHDVVMRALASVRERVPEVQWVVIGDGPLRPRLEALARDCGVDGVVRFLGAVSDEERDEWLRRMDVFVMPSRLPRAGRAGEGFGIVYLEAGARAKPVVAGNVAGAPDAVRDGETGLLVDPTDPAAVADALSRLLLDRELAAKLGRAGAEHAREFAWPLIARRVRALLCEQLPAGIAP
jgi:phosphatidylinositol alpha-1,6-mannosyltransferase